MEEERRRTARYSGEVEEADNRWNDEGGEGKRRRRRRRNDGWGEGERRRRNKKR